MDDDPAGSGVSWLSPERLWLLAAVAALAVAYVVVQRRRGHYAERYTNPKMFGRLAPRRPVWRRHVPATLFLAMLALGVVGFARPQSEVRVPRESATVVIAVDVSGSMTATDIAPNRLAAARAAAHQFVAGLPEKFSVGLVAFGGTGAVLVAPVTDQAAVDTGIDTLAEGVAGPGGSAIGEAIAASLQAIQTVGAAPGGEAPPARVVLLSDGDNTRGRDPDVLAREAAARGIPVDTISFGTPDGVMRGGSLVPVDGQTLREVSATTDGRYYEAADADELRAAYVDIGTTVGYQNEMQDVSSRFAGIALALAALTALMSLLWFARLP